jgi:hypothetical protein
VRFEIRSGALSWRTTKAIRFDELASLELITIARRRKSASYRLSCILKNGAAEVFVVGDALTDATAEIVGRALKQGVTVNGLTAGHLPFVFGPIPKFDGKLPSD